MTLMWKCDVCEKTGESPTSASQFRLLPRGWRMREGRVPGRHEVEVHVCSDKCAKRYDAVEADEVGFAWRRPDAETLDAETKHSVRPLTVK
jgi:hypothetical protein